jgi:hypothetical protein
MNSNKIPSLIKMKRPPSWKNIDQEQFNQMCSEKLLKMMINFNHSNYLFTSFHL